MIGLKSVNDTFIYEFLIWQRCAILFNTEKVVGESGPALNVYKDALTLLILTRNAYVSFEKHL